MGLCSFMSFCFYPPKVGTTPSRWGTPSTEDTRWCPNSAGVISPLYGSARTSSRFILRLCDMIRVEAVEKFDLIRHHIIIIIKNWIKQIFSLSLLLCPVTSMHIWSGVCVGRLGRRVAVKVLKSGAGFTQAGEDELALLRCVSDRLLVNLLSERSVCQIFFSVISLEHHSLPIF